MPSTGSPRAVYEQSWEFSAWNRIDLPGTTEPTKAAGMVDDIGRADHADQLTVIEHRQMAQPVLAHQRNDRVDVVFRPTFQTPRVM